MIDVCVYYGGNGKKYVNGNAGFYGTSWGATGDIIAIQIDLRTMNLSFEVNGKNQGLVCPLKQKSYHFVLSMTDINDSICVMSEKIILKNSQRSANGFFVFLFFCFFVFGIKQHKTKYIKYQKCI